MSHTSTYTLTWKDVEDAIANLEYYCLHTLKTRSNNTTVYGIPKGGIIPALLLSKRLDCKFDILTIPTTYKITNDPSTHSIIVDDISDTGKTLEWYKNNLIDSKYSILTICERHSTTVRPDKSHLHITNEDWIIFPWEDGPNG